MLLGRLFSYPDTHRYRIGTNYLQLPINAPKSAVKQLQQGRLDALPPQRERVIEYWTNVDSELGSRVAQGIQASSGAGSNGSGAANAPRGEEPVGSSASTGL